MKSMNLPAPGLDGTYRDSCVVCFHGADTGLALTGEAEWIIAHIMTLGIPEDQAMMLVSMNTGCDIGKVPVGDTTLVFRVCRDCAARAGSGSEHPKVGLIAGGELPCYTQPQEGRAA